MSLNTESIFDSIVSVLLIELKRLSFIDSKSLLRDAKSSNNPFESLSILFSRLTLKSFNLSDKVSISPLKSKSIPSILFFNSDKLFSKLSTLLKSSLKVIKEFSNFDLSSVNASILLSSFISLISFFKDST